MRIRFAVLAALAAAPVAAQAPLRYEAGFFGALTRYDASFDLGHSLGGGARLGYLITPSFEIEADVLFPGSDSGRTAFAPFTPVLGGASVVVNFPAGPRMTPYVLAGYSRLDFGNTAPYAFVDGAVHGGVGDRIFFSPTAAFRVEARAYYAPSTQAAFGKSSALHLVFSAGLTFYQFGPKPKDADGDGVADKHDRCPNTPAGAVVDRNGCPLDADQDGVADGIDKCPDTPAGATVDAAGCPSDADKDGVLDGIDKCADTPAGAVVDQTGCPVDADQDGVADGIDKCPDTPAGATVDATGCPSDADKDGVLDGIDKCPNTLTGATVDATGCPLDADKDGVPDGLDKCPATPPGTPVDAVGCPVTADADGDGVPDVSDKCPNTPRGVAVDATGCMVLFAEPKAAAPGAAPARPALVLQGVNFRTGSSVLTTDSYTTLDAVAASLVANPDIRIEIAGYTDNTGSRFVNVRLSQARAFAVRAYLARKGVAPARMVARGYGMANPIASNATPEGRAQNRRVELHKLP